MFLNKTAQLIYDDLEVGENMVCIDRWSKELGLCKTTVFKYLRLLEENQLIKKIVFSRAGGGKNDSRVQTVITKY